MKKYLSIFKLKKEAELLDSRLYILKAFFAVATAYFIATNNKIARLDTISVLFGLMLTLEPVTLAGVRNGFNQVYASILGAAATSIIIFIGGINIWTIAIAMSFTLYVCLKLNWREVSPVAIFTSIYMTQYIQKTPQGVPSIWLTFRLRLIALGVGVLVAIAYNFIFSILYYRKMLYKRITFILLSISNNLKHTKKIIESKELSDIDLLKSELQETFNNIEWIFRHFKDIDKESKMKLKVADVKNLSNLQEIVILCKSICHINYDICYYLGKNAENSLNNKDIIYKIDIIIEKTDMLADVFENKLKRTDIELNGIEGIEIKEGRIDEDINDIIFNLNSIISKTNSMLY